MPQEFKVSDRVSYTIAHEGFRANRDKHKNTVIGTVISIGPKLIHVRFGDGGHTTIKKIPPERLIKI